MNAPLIAPTEVPTTNSRDDAALIRRAQHVDLYRPQAGGPGEDERDAIRGEPTLVRA
jgi:hypothetical protein